jgi:hypothetical protein
MRWLLATVPSSMIFDDHDVHDDWNTSKTWVTDIRAQGWWDDRIVGGFMSYWICGRVLDPGDAWSTRTSGAGSRSTRAAAARTC